jgi:hypothetical protein
MEFNPPIRDWEGKWKQKKDYSIKNDNHCVRVKEMHLVQKK